MKISQADRLRNLALSIAAKSGGLNLSNVKGDQSSFAELSIGTVQSGERVLVVGAADGHIAYEAARQAGPSGAVVALENDVALLGQAQEQAAAFEGEHGYLNVRLVRTELSDFATDPGFVNEFLAERPVADLDAYLELQSRLEQQRTERPLLADDSFDVIILDAVINRLPLAEGVKALSEAFRVLRRGGRLYVSALLADEAVTAALPKLPNGLAVQHAPLETGILALLDQAGFYGMSMIWRAELPMNVVEGSELRTFVLEAHKGKQGVCLDQGHAVIYKGPWSQVSDDDDHVYVRGARTAVCAKTYDILMRAPYKGHFIGVPAYVTVPLDQAPLFDCNTPQLRDPQVTKGKLSVFDQPSPAASSCCPAPADSASDGDCCGTGGCC